MTAPRREGRSSRCPWRAEDPAEATMDLWQPPGPPKPRAAKDFPCRGVLCRAIRAANWFPFRLIARSARGIPRETNLPPPSVRRCASAVNGSAARTPAMAGPSPAGISPAG
ncbi:hypothetical protein PB2503_00512 [Parvularcula bermudensis HTCC2503]|uniref:Uncharacterized protein n=1 Tax=Parvularcula bermudensis (strain ATCC BAA-594 / HTCC2503 / KCTC 12087) TaxID=314260 RepID=E0TAX4_PARBH|nr:hypothetical protein PB2503_00512 [Parvularcula bermudensis HTCC2503]